MLPFGVLRLWGIGLLGWAILAAGIYCFYEWADGVGPVAMRPADDEAVLDDAARAGATVAVTAKAADRQGGWPYLASGMALVGLSLLGWLPATLILGKPGFGEPRAESMGKRHFVERDDGTKLHVQIHGPNHGPTLVFTHGWTLDSTAWYYARRDIQDRYRMVFWDLPGLGGSKGPDNADYSLEKMARDLHTVIREAARGPVVLVGHSIGGMTTQTFCRLYRNELSSRVAGIVLVHTTYTNPLRTAFLAPLWTALERPLIVPLNHLTIWLAPLAWLMNWQSYLNGSLHIFSRIASFSGNQNWGQLEYSARLAAR